MLGNILTVELQDSGMINKRISDLKIIVDPTILNDIHEWVLSVDRERPELENLKICPYAKKFESELTIAQLPYPELFSIEEDFVMIIFIAPDTITWDELKSYCDRLRDINPELVFLTDHCSKPTYMNGQQTNNTKYHAIACQPGKKLASARRPMQKTNWYGLWSTKEWETLMEARNINDQTDVE
jgi:hypothetical protein